jgi:hypothetical protein
MNKTIYIKTPKFGKKMKAENTPENIMIAKFEGLTESESGQWLIGDGVEYDGILWGQSAGHILRYDESLDWLKPVILKIRKVRTGKWNTVGSNLKNDIDQELLELSIKDIYKAVLTFILWYNNKK